MAFDYGLDQLAHDASKGIYDEAHEHLYEKGDQMRQPIYDAIFALVKAGAILTGSRAFGYETSTSDWDFFISGDKQKEIRLLLLAYELESDTSYKDSNTAEVWKHKRFPIHVQITKDMALKQKAQDYLLSMPSLFLRAMHDKDASKISRRTVWGWAFKQVSK